MGGISTTLIILLAGFVGLWLVGIPLIVLFAILRGQISLRRLLVEPLTDKPAAFSRPQLVVSTFAAIGGYAALALDQLGVTNSLPEAPIWVVASLAGSHAIYLGSRGLAANALNSIGRRIGL